MIIKTQIKTFSIFFGIIVILSNTISAFGKEEAKSSGDTYQLEEIVVTATRMETPLENVAANITVINRADIEKMAASSIADVLKNIPGVYVELNGGLGSSASVRIQGSEIRHVAIYQDGVPLNQLANPLTDLSFLPVETIERVEIYKGSASSVSGSSLGGVINIITRESNGKSDGEPDEKSGKKLIFSADLKSSYGNFNTVKNRGTLSGAVDDFSYLLSYTNDKSDGFIDFTQYYQEAIYTKIKYDISEQSSVHFILSFDKGRSEDPILNKPDYWNDNNQMRRYQKFGFETYINDDIFFILEGWHHTYDTLINRNYSDHQEIFNDYEDESWGGSARISYDINDSNTLNFGFDAEVGEYDWINYTQKYTTKNLAAYINDTYTIYDFTFNAGVRLDDNQKFGSVVSQSFGIVYHFFDNNALIRFQTAKGFSAPPASWVDDPNYGNTDLKPEIAVNYQIGTQINFFKFLIFETNLFRSNVDDLINYNYDTKQLYNIDKATRSGIEGNLSARFDFGSESRLNLGFGYSFIDVQNKTTDEKIQDIPKTMYKISSTLTYKWMTHSLTGNYIDHNSSYDETKDKVFVFDYLVNIKLPVLERYCKATLFGAGYNIFNTNYIYRDVWPKPGRWIEAGIRFEF